MVINLYFYTHNYKLGYINLFFLAYNEKDYSRFSMAYFGEEYKEKVESVTPKIKDLEEEAFVQEITKSLLGFTKKLIKGMVKAFLPLEIDVKPFVYLFIYFSLTKTKILKIIIFYFQMSGMDSKVDLLKLLLTNKEGGVPSYLYAFKYHGSEHYFAKKEGSWLKNYVTLLDDNVYLFKPEKVLSDEDKRMSKIMVDLWTSFAQNGVPKTNELDIEWPQIEDTDGPYLILDKSVKIGTDYSKELTPLIDCESSNDCEWLDDSGVENFVATLDNDLK